MDRDGLSEASRGFLIVRAAAVHDEDFPGFRARTERSVWARQTASFRVEIMTEIDPSIRNPLPASILASPLKVFVRAGNDTIELQGTIRVFLGATSGSVSLDEGERGQSPGRA